MLTRNSGGTPGNTPSSMRVDHVDGLFELKRSLVSTASHIVLEQFEIVTAFSFLLLAPSATTSMRASLPRPAAGAHIKARADIVADALPVAHAGIGAQVGLDRGLYFVAVLGAVSYRQTDAELSVADRGVPGGIEERQAIGLANDRIVRWETRILTRRSRSRLNPSRRWRTCLRPSGRFWLSRPHRGLVV